MVNAGYDSPPSEPSGRIFGPYEIIRRLGVGGMAATFEAIRRGPGDFTQRVCLKLVQPFFRDKQDFLQLFEREAQLAAKLRHSNIVGVIDFGRIDGVTYMAVELVDGIDLATLLDAQPGRILPHEQVALLGHELARALEHAHDPRRNGGEGESPDNTIIHRDVSPSNVMISQRGEVLLTDFGLAKVVTSTARQQSAVKGKVPYMSPEQLRAEPLDGRSDLFSLGVVLFEALAGYRPFQGDHDPATIMMILKGERPTLQSLSLEAPPGLCDVIESLLEVDRDRRPKSATALLELLEPFVPSPRTARELGKQVSEARAFGLAQSSGSSPIGNEAMDLLPGLDVAATGSAPPIAGQTPVAPEPRPAISSGEGSSGRRRGLLVALSLGVAIAGAIALWPMGAGAPSSRPGDADGAAPVRDEISTDASFVVDPASKAARESGSDAEGSDEPDEGTGAIVPPPRPARLKVVVFPWGQVWIDDEARGSAPLKNVSLPPGRYKISVGQGKPTVTRIVHLRAGERETVQFDLSPASAR